MVMTESTMLKLGTPAPDFSLPDVVSGKKVSPADYRDKPGLLVMFICRHCPFVQHIKKEVARIGKDYANKSLGIVAISSNDAANYPDDSPDSLKSFAQEEGFVFPLCYDEDQSAAKAYTAACTPDFFLFDKSRRLVYRGQLDDSRPSNGKPVTGKDLRAALDAVLAGKPVSPDQKPSIGCNIKWKAGNAPAYFLR
jgi:peroxiredoxin